MTVHQLVLLAAEHHDKGVGKTNKIHVGFTTVVQ